MQHVDLLSRSQEALEVIEAAVGHYRRLTATEPEAFSSGLAGSLSNLSIILGGLGRWEQAFEAASEAADLRRRLIPEQPDRGA